jgi:hypothetical protein
LPHLLPRVITERHDDKPSPAGLLSASEWLTFDTSDSDAVLASLADQPVVVSRAFGRGRVITSGALDAWRFRLANDGFAIFWTSLAWDAARLAGPRLRVASDRSLAQPGEEVQISVELQSLREAPLPTTTVANAWVECGDDRQHVRLWPNARPRTFSGTVRVERPGTCVIDVRVDDATGRTPLTIRSGLRELPSRSNRLHSIAAAHGATLASPSDVGMLLTQLRMQIDDRRRATSMWPMRSPYWLVPFVLCLAGEWWLRRRSGLS